MYVIGVYIGKYRCIYRKTYIIDLTYPICIVYIILQISCHSGKIHSIVKCWMIKQSSQKSTQDQKSIMWGIRNFMLRYQSNCTGQLPKEVVPFLSLWRAHLSAVQCAAAVILRLVPKDTQRKGNIYSWCSPEEADRLWNETYLCFNLGDGTYQLMKPSKSINSWKILTFKLNTH